MGQTWGALAVAVVGVIGTLGAALLTQSRADRLKRHELEAMARQQREERAHAEHVRQQEARLVARREMIDLRRACYISLNTTARQYQTAQINLMHALRARDDAEACTCVEQLEERRLVLRDSYAEAQMILPRAVLEDARAANQQLNNTYGLLKRMVAGGHPNAGELDALHIETEMSWALLSDLRAAMRHDLGVDEASEE
ncbi:hypothetical protein DCW30_35380 [Streptomyces alfalfae]|uniref:Uncharacterized protein n=1 Tax=Streptomyces alfalfae TaxID=1642299 RepID=A0A1P8TRC6_9ACTN|nr:hypothetical protein [Streptomyces alfalfae]AYA21579.1 hypothetical protein D3X13_34285 [Streptomyces fradiae]APY90173.1 hypothetical protein A7J05_34950 [Streptomyces alfalfae]QQC87307.1 hypothetical protein I8755_01940 [Streptomyces alfalfae]QUI29744.1 hypothetical protein H9W91_01850 [Streptomyces alfalfae]RXX35046.1 hypothetical protein DCW30_35380 [Streptomyces alfalfae]